MCPALVPQAPSQAPGGERARKQQEYKHSGSEQHWPSRSTKASHIVSIHISALQVGDAPAACLMQKHTLHRWGKEPHDAVMCHL